MLDEVRPAGGQPLGLLGPPAEQPAEGRRRIDLRYRVRLVSRTGATVGEHERQGHVDVPKDATGAAVATVELTYGAQRFIGTANLPLDVPEGSVVVVNISAPIEPRTVEELDVQRDEDGALVGLTKAIY